MYSAYGDIVINRLLRHRVWRGLGRCVVRWLDCEFVMLKTGYKGKSNLVSLKREECILL
jgi:hypothetical protein